MRAAAAGLGIAAFAFLAGCDRGEEAGGPIPIGADARPPNSDVALDPAEAARLAREIAASTNAIVSPGFELTLFAPEPLVADPIGISVDPVTGRVLYTKTNRSNQAEFDIRDHRDWMIESITFRTVEDRRQFLHRELAPERSAENEWLPDFNGDGSRDWRDLTVPREEIYALEDTSGDGVADLARLLIADFHEEHTDVANGVLAHGSDIYVSVAPDLWRLRDTNGDGLPDTKESLAYGFGVHIGFSGHGLSGITVGPDGRLYYGIGDPGANVVDRDGRRWEYPNQGVIARSELDGSNFEIFAHGVRNTHEFDFDEFGNLISVDNDGDHPGEQERIVYLVDGSDSGWRINWQFGKYDDPLNNSYKVWMEEGLSLPRFEGQAAYILPPIASYHAGPAGMVYNPGTALSPEWRNHFFVSAFTGSPANTRINAFQLEPEGAGFRLARDTVILRGILTTGIDVGPDGALYLADWIDGWDIKRQGRVWKLDTPSEAGSEIRRETQQLLASDFANRSEDDLLALLRHADMRVRLKAQFELAGRVSVESLLNAARQTDHRLARLHGIWGIGQLARREASHASALLPILHDLDPEVRAQAANVLGDVRYADAGDQLIPLLADSEPRVRFFAAQALGRIGHGAAVQPLIRMLEENDDRDTYLRHAGSLALARIGQPEPVVALASHPSRAVRIAAVVALRRMRDPGVARFLQDADEYIVTEAARAINDDESIEAALPDLARVLDDPRFTSEPLLRRAINANLRLGTAEAAARLAAYAGRRSAPEELRNDAIGALGVFPAPSVLDRVDGYARGAVQRDPAIARDAIEPIIPTLVADPAPGVRLAAVEAAGRLGLQDSAPLLAARLEDDSSPQVRTAALRALAAMQTDPLEPHVRAALGDADAGVRMAALELIPRIQLPPAVTAELLASVVGRGSIIEQQAAVTALSSLRTPEAAGSLSALLDRFEAGDLPRAVELELFEAIDSAGSPALAARAQQLQEARAGGDPVALLTMALEGGDRGRGLQIAQRNESAQCARCHAFAAGGADVGPDLRGVGSRLSRLQLLEALVAPSARLAPGYGTTTVTLGGGEVVSGTILEESEGSLVLRTATQPRRTIPSSAITARADDPSAMPPMQNVLTRRQLRDVVEYLATLR